MGRCSLRIGEGWVLFWESGEATALGDGCPSSKTEKERNELFFFLMYLSTSYHCPWGKWLILNLLTTSFLLNIQSALKMRSKDHVYVLPHNPQEVTGLSVLRSHSYHCCLSRLFVCSSGGRVEEFGCLHSRHCHRLWVSYSNLYPESDLCGHGWKRRTSDQRINGIVSVVGGRRRGLVLDKEHPRLSGWATKADTGARKESNQLYRAHPQSPGHGCGEAAVCSHANPWAQPSFTGFLLTEPFFAFRIQFYQV